MERVVYTVGQHIFEDKNFEDFTDIYPASKIFILKIFLQHFGNILNRRLSSKICPRKFPFKADFWQPSKVYLLENMSPYGITDLL